MEADHDPYSRQRKEGRITENNTKDHGPYSRQRIEGRQQEDPTPLKKKNKTNRRVIGLFIKAHSILFNCIIILWNIVIKILSEKNHLMLRDIFRCIETNNPMKIARPSTKVWYILIMTEFEMYLNTLFLYSYSSKNLSFSSPYIHIRRIIHSVQTKNATNWAIHYTEHTKLNSLNRDYKNDYARASLGA